MICASRQSSLKNPHPCCKECENHLSGCKEPCPSAGRSNLCLVDDGECVASQCPLYYPGPLKRMIPDIEGSIPSGDPEEDGTVHSVFQ